MESDDRIKHFNEFYEPAHRHQAAMAGQWDEYEKAYLADPLPEDKPSGEDSWRSFLFFKYGWQQIQTLVAELASDDDPSFLWEARSFENDKYASVVENIVKYQLQRDYYPDKRFMAVLTAAVYGGCPVKVHWRYDCQKRKHPVTGDVSEIILADQPTITLVDPRDFFYDLRARSMRDARYAFHRMRLSLDELKSKKRADGSPLYENLDKLSETDAGFPEDGQLDNDHSGERDKARRKGIEVIEMWSRDRLLVRAGGGTIIRDEPNPYKHGRLPFEVITLLPSLNDVWGISIMWALRDVQELIHSLDNASMDALKLQINPPLAIDVIDDDENSERPLFPGQRFPSRNAKDAVVPIRVTGTEPFVNQQAIQATREQLEYITGISKELAGASDSSTATQAALNQRQAKGRIGIMMRNIDAAFARCAEMILQLNQQYLDVSVPQKVAGTEGAEWKLIAPAQIAGVWDVRPKNSSEQATKELHRQNLLECLNTLMPAMSAVLPSGKTVDITPILENLADSFNVEKERVLVDVSQLYAQRQQEAVAQSVAGAQAQAEAMKILPPQDPAAAAQHKMFESLNFKDLPTAAKGAMLQQAGLPADGVGDPTQDPATMQNPLAQALAQHAAPQPQPQPAAVNA